MGPKTREWSLADDDLDTAMGPATGTHDIENGAGDVQLDDLGQAAEMVSGRTFEDTHGAKTESSRDRQVKPNKIYIGGLPDHTRPEDLQNCFGKIGNIVTIELKLGYGFVEFESREAAEESVTRYHEGYFMGNKIRVEPSHSRGRTTFKRSDDPGACFRCGENGHWARECPRPSTQSRGGSTYDIPSHDRGRDVRDYHQSKNGHSYRDEYSRHPSSRDDRYYDTPQAPPTRDHRRAVTPPPRDRRDDPAPRHEYDDHRMRSPLPQPPATRYERTRRHGSGRDYHSSGAPDRDDRHDQRPPQEDRSAPYSAHSGRPRTPPGPPPSSRDEYDKAPRGHHQTRRPVTPPPPYPGSSANGARSRRRSLSPVPRYDSRHGGPAHSDERYSGRESTRVRDYHRSNRAEESGYRRS